MRKIFIAVLLFIVGLMALSAYFDLKQETLTTKVIELQQQQLISGAGKAVSTEIRYLVVTEKETFICESSFINMKFNNSDEFLRLKKDSIYTFKVCGIGKTFFTDYRNILAVSSPNK